MLEPLTDFSRAVASTGIAGLDDVMSGGFTQRRLFLVEGVPGSGKTTLALQYLMAGASRGEPVLYITLSETEEELRDVAASHGWNLDGIAIRELAPQEAALDIDEQNTMFHPSEVELASTTKLILADVERLKPTRVVFDSLSELRLLAGSALRYRRQILALKQFFATRQCTVMLLDDLTSTDKDLQVQSIAHGVILLDHVQSGVRLGASPVAGRQVPRRAVPRRLPRLRDQARRRRGVSSTRGRRTSADLHVREASQRHQGARRAARRRHRRRHEQPDRGCGGHREIDPGRAVRCIGREPRSARGAVHVR